jgi:membrane protease subunit (stomatin/prohibitin family)
MIDSLNIKWGTPTRMAIKEPNYNVILSIGANGQFGMRVTDARDLLVKLVGTTSDFTQESIKKYFRSVLLANIKTYLSQTLVEKNVSILEVNSHLLEISEEVGKELRKVFAKYGLEIVDFVISNVDADEDDPSYQALTSALNEQARLSILQANYQQERSFDVMQTAVANESEGSAGMMQTGMGLGMGVQMGQGVGNMMGGILQNAMPGGGSTPVAAVVGAESATTPKFCANCGSALTPGAKFCPNCGNKL